MNLLVTVEVFNGLANRLRAVWSAEAFSRHYHLRTRIRWPITADFPTEHRRLLINKSNISISDVSCLTYWQNVRFRAERLLLSGLSTGYERRRSIPWVKVFEPERPRSPLYWLRSCEEFHAWGGVPCPFVPSHEVERIVAERLDRLEISNAALIGVHIRRGDHKQARQNSPLQVFIDRISEILSAEPSARFLICSDDSQEIQQLRQIFGPQSILPSLTEVLDRWHPEAAVQAMADLVMLSRSRRILGSSLSSFSEMASFLTGTELEQLSLDNASLPSAAEHS